MIDFVDAIKSLDSSYNVYIDGDINSQEDWDNKVKFITGKDADDNAIFSNTKPVTYQQVLDKQAELQADYDSKEYQRKRAAKYPSYGDQMDYIYHNGIDAWKADMIDPVKNKYPKDNS
jgi:hypothetical protein